MIPLQAIYFHEQVIGPATVIGTAKDGQARVERDSIYRDKDVIFGADDAEAVRLIESGAARKPRLSGEAKALAEAVLPAATALDAALDALPLPRIRVWHAVQDGRYWCPAPAALGPGRGGFSARLRDPGEARALWTEKPDAVPLFSFSSPYGFSKAFIWRNRGLLEIATEVQHVGRNLP